MASKNKSDANGLLQTIKEYMITRNRPFGLNDILESHKDFGKSAIEKCLETLVRQGDLRDKLFGKQKIYFPNQDQFSVFKDDESYNIHESIREKSKEQKTLTDEYKRLEDEIRFYENSLPTVDLEQQLTSLKQSCAEIESKLENFRSNVRLVDPAEKAKTESKNTTFSTEWRKRKALASEMTDMILEGCGKKRRDLLEEIGVETDEDLGVSLL